MTRVRVTYFDAKAMQRREFIAVYRWRWWARIQAWTINVAPLVGGGLVFTDAEVLP